MKYLIEPLLEWISFPRRDYEMGPAIKFCIVKIEPIRKRRFLLCFCKYCGQENSWVNWLGSMFSNTTIGCFQHIIDSDHIRFKNLGNEWHDATLTLLRNPLWIDLVPEGHLRLDWYIFQHSDWISTHLKCPRSFDIDFERENY